MSAEILLTAQVKSMCPPKFFSARKKMACACAGLRGRATEKHVRRQTRRLAQDIGVCSRKFARARTHKGCARIILRVCPPPRDSFAVTPSRGTVAAQSLNHPHEQNKPTQKANTYHAGRRCCRPIVHYKTKQMCCDAWTPRCGKCEFNGGVILRPGGFYCLIRILLSN